MSESNIGRRDNPHQNRAGELFLRYEHLDHQEMDELHHLFRKKLTSLDVGMLASDPALYPHVRAYKQKFVNKIGVKDVCQVVAIMAVFVTCAWAIKALADAF